MSAGQLAHLNTHVGPMPDHHPEALFQSRSDSSDVFSALLGSSPVMQRLFAQMRTTVGHLRVASLEGGAGTGKTMVAQVLHQAGPAGKGRFVPARAGTFFTEQSQTILAEASSGTLFLSHIDELDRKQQSRLTDFLEWLEHQHVRGSNYVPRQIFVSSRHSLRRLTSEGQMRSELSHRLGAVTFQLPPLTERRQDIGLLATHFAQEFSRLNGKPIRGLGPGALPRLQAHLWPGNVRELRSVINSACLSCEGQWLRPIDIPVLNATACDSATYDETEGIPAAVMNDRLEVQHSSPKESHTAFNPNLDSAILHHVGLVLARVGGNKLRAAQLLGISRSTLYRLLETQTLGSKL